MPGSILNADINFPHFTGQETTDEKLGIVTDYLYMLYEQLRYSMSNLGVENFNDAELKDIITMSAKQIDLTGYVTFNSLSTPGQTIIDGANISTGYIAADRLNLTGAITFGDLSTNMQNVINGKTDAGQVGTLITDYLVASPQIYGGSFHDLRNQSVLNITSGSGVYNMLFGATGTTSLANSSFAISHDTVDGADRLYLAGNLIMSSSFDYDRVIVDTEAWFSNKMMVSSYSYGTSLPPSIASQRNTGEVFFLI